MTLDTSRMESATFDRRIMARDLKKDLKHLKRNGVDPKSFLQGLFYRLVRNLED